MSAVSAGRPRWIDRERQTRAEPDVDAFLEALLAVCRQHRLMLSHDNAPGAFEVEAFDEKLVEPILAASDCRSFTDLFTEIRAS